MINKNQLKELIKDLVRIQEEVIKELAKEYGVDSTRFLLPYPIVFSEACSYQRGMLAQESKRENIKHFEEKKEFKEVFKETPITDNQNKFIKINEKEMRRRGFDVDNIKNKSDAFKVISEFKKGMGGREEF